HGLLEEVLDDALGRGRARRPKDEVNRLQVGVRDNRLECAPGSTQIVLDVIEGGHCAAQDLNGIEVPQALPESALLVTGSGFLWHTAVVIPTPDPVHQGRQYGPRAQNSSELPQSLVVPRRLGAVFLQ